MSTIISRVEPQQGTVLKMLEDIKAEKRGESNISIPYRLLSRAIGGGLKRGFVSVVAGPPSNGKSYYAYSLLLWCMTHGIKAMYLPLEYKAEDHIRRILAAHMSSWMMAEDNQATAEERLNVFRDSDDAINLVGYMEKRVLSNPAKIEHDRDGVPFVRDIPYREMIEIYQHYSKQCDLFIVDPITAIDMEHNGTPEFKQQEKYIKSVGAIAKESNTHAVLISHTGKRKKHNGQEAGLTMDDVAGAAAISRFSQYLFLLDYHKKQKSWVERFADGKCEVDHARTMIVGKANFGPGKGQRIAFDFEKSGPRMKELGVITTEDEE